MINAQRLKVVRSLLLRTDQLIEQVLVIAGARAGRAAALSRSVRLRSYAILARAASVSCRVNARSVSVRTLPRDPKE
jgi:hypothetical protein